MTGTLTAIFALLLGTSLFVAGSGLLNTAVALRADALGFSGSLTGTIMAAYFAGYVAATYWCPRIVRQAGHVRAFSAFAATAAAALLLHPLVPSAPIWLVLRFLTGACVVGLYMVIESWLNERSSNANRGRVFAVYQVIALLALALGQYLLLLPSPDPAAPFIVAAALFSIGLVPVVLTRVEHPKPISSVELKLGRLWAISPLSVVGTFMVALGNGALIALGPVFGQRIGFGTVEVALFMSLIFGGGVVLQWPIGQLSDTWDRRTVILLVSLGGAGAALVAGAFVDRSLPGLLIAMFCYGGAAFSLYPLCVANANDHTDDDFVATASGLLLIYGIGAAIGPAVAGALLQAFGTPSLPLFLATMLLALAAFVARRKVASAPPPADAQEPFVMLGRTSQSAIEMLTAEGQGNGGRGSDRRGADSLS
jgi:MFS family permease